MAIPHAKPGEVVDVRPLGSSLAGTKTRTLLKTENVEVVRIVMTAGKEISEHEAPGEIIVQCLEARSPSRRLAGLWNLQPGNCSTWPPSSRTR